jgi:excisionase family DNA binding protein
MILDFQKPPEESGAKFFENREVGEWLTSTEAAQFLGITPNALRIKVCRGTVKYWKLGSRLRFRATELSRLLLKGA